MADRRKVLVVQPISPVAMELFAARDDVTVEVLPDFRPGTIAAAIVDAHAVLIRDAPLAGAAVEAAERLRVVSRHGVGYDNVPIAACTAKGVPVTIIGDVNTTAVAEHALYLLLAVAKNGPRFDQAVRAGDFAARGRRTNTELRGKTLALVGYGRIGQELASRARALGMTIAAYDPWADRRLHADVAFADTLETLLEHADVVSLHVPLTPDTRGLIGAHAFARMKAGAILVNAARGGIVDEPALIAALEGGRLAGAGLDVFAREPVTADDPLLAREDIVFSPHNAALTAESLVEMGRAAVCNVLDAFDGKLDPKLVVNREALG